MRDQEKRCIIEVFRPRYKQGSRRVKGEILGEVCERLKVGRRHARRLLAGRMLGRPKKPEARGRPRKYGNPEFVSALRYVWKTSRFMCSRVSAPN